MSNESFKVPRIPIDTVLLNNNNIFVLPSPKKDNDIIPVSIIDGNITPNNILPYESKRYQSVSDYKTDVLVPPPKYIVDQCEINRCTKKINNSPKIFNESPMFTKSLPNSVQNTPRKLINNINSNIYYVKVITIYGHNSPSFKVKDDTIEYYNKENDIIFCKNNKLFTLQIFKNNQFVDYDVPLGSICVVESEKNSIYIRYQNNNDNTQNWIKYIFGGTLNKEIKDALNKLKLNNNQINNELSEILNITIINEKVNNSIINNLIVKNKSEINDLKINKNLLVSGDTELNNLDIDNKLIVNGLSEFTEINSKEIISDNIKSNKINSDNLTINSKINSKEITTDNITSDKINSKDINSDNLTINSKINSKEIISDNIKSNNINSDNLTINSALNSKEIITDNINSKEIITDNINSKEITTDNIKSNNINSDNLTINSQINSKEITTNNINSKEITTDNIKSNNINTDIITSTNISSDNITTTTLNTNKLISNNLEVNTLSINNYAEINNINENNKNSIINIDYFKNNQQIYFVDTIINQNQVFTTNYIFYQNNNTFLLQEWKNNKYESINIKNNTLCIIKDIKIIYIYDNNSWILLNNITPFFYVKKINNKHDITNDELIFIQHKNNRYTLKKYHNNKYSKYSVPYGAMCIIEQTNDIFIKYNNINNKQNWVKLNNFNPHETLILYNTTNNSLISYGSISINGLENKNKLINNNDIIINNHSLQINNNGLFKISKENDEFNIYSDNDINIYSNNKINSIKIGKLTEVNNLLILNNGAKTSDTYKPLDNNDIIDKKYFDNNKISFILCKDVINNDKYDFINDNYYLFNGKLIKYQNNNINVLTLCENSLCFCENTKEFFVYKNNKWLELEINRNNNIFICDGFINNKLINNHYYFTSDLILKLYKNNKFNDVLINNGNLCFNKEQQIYYYAYLKNNKIIWNKLINDNKYIDNIDENNKNSIINIDYFIKNSKIFYVDDFNTKNKDILFNGKLMKYENNKLIEFNVDNGSLCIIGKTKQIYIKCNNNWELYENNKSIDKFNKQIELQHLQIDNNLLVNGNSNLNNLEVNKENVDKLFVNYEEINDSKINNLLINECKSNNININNKLISNFADIKESNLNKINNEILNSNKSTIKSLSTESINIQSGLLHKVNMNNPYSLINIDYFNKHNIIINYHVDSIVENFKNVPKINNKLTFLKTNNLLTLYKYNSSINNFETYDAPLGTICCVEDTKDIYIRFNNDNEYNQIWIKYNNININDAQFDKINCKNININNGLINNVLNNNKSIVNKEYVDNIKQYYYICDDIIYNLNINNISNGLYLIYVNNNLKLYNIINKKKIEVTLNNNSLCYCKSNKQFYIFNEKWIALNNNEIYYIENIINENELQQNISFNTNSYYFINTIINNANYLILKYYSNNFYNIYVHKGNIAFNKYDNSLYICDELHIDNNIYYIWTKLFNNYSEILNIKEINFDNSKEILFNIKHINTSLNNIDIVNIINFKWFDNYYFIIFGNNNTLNDNNAFINIINIKTGDIIIPSTYKINNITLSNITNSIIIYDNNDIIFNVYFIVKNQQFLIKYKLYLNNANKIIFEPIDLISLSYNINYIFLKNNDRFYLSNSINNTIIYKNEQEIININKVYTKFYIMVYNLSILIFLYNDSNVICILEYKNNKIINKTNLKLDFNIKYITRCTIKNNTLLAFNDNNVYILKYSLKSKIIEDSLGDKYININPKLKYYNLISYEQSEIIKNISNTLSGYIVIITNKNYYIYTISSIKNENNKFKIDMMYNLNIKNKYIINTLCLMFNDEPLFLIDDNKYIIIKTNDLCKSIINKNIFKHNNLISTNNYTRLLKTNDYDTDLITNKKLYNILNLLITELQIDNKDDFINKLLNLFNVNDINSFISNI